MKLARKALYHRGAVVLNTLPYHKFFNFIYILLSSTYHKYYIFVDFSIVLFVKYFVIYENYCNLDNLYYTAPFVLEIVKFL